MTPTEVVILAKYMRAHFPQQPMDEYTSEALSELLDPYPLADCRRAVLNIAERGEQWCSPSAVRLEVKRIRARRVDTAPPATPPPGLDPDNAVEFNAWLAEHRRLVADGTPPADPAYLPTRHLGEIRALLPRMPKVDTKPPARSAEHDAGMEAARAELAARTQVPVADSLEAVLSSAPMREDVAAAVSSGEVGTGAGGGGDRATAEATPWVNRSMDCPEAPAQAHLLAPAAEVAIAEGASA